MKLQHRREAEHTKIKMHVIHIEEEEAQDDITPRIWLLCILMSERKIEERD